MAVFDDLEPSEKLKVYNRVVEVLETASRSLDQNGVPVAIEGWS